MKINWQKTAAIAGVAGFALVLLTNQEAQAAIGGFFGEKSVKGSGTVGGGILPSFPSTNGVPSAAETLTKKEQVVTGTIPTSFIQPDAGRIAASDIRGYFETSLQLTPDTFARTGQNTYSGQRTLDSKKSVYVEGNLDIAGNTLNQQTGQLYTDLGDGLKLYSEKSTTDIPGTKKESATQPAQTTVVTSSGSAVYEGSKKVASTTNKPRTDSSGKATQTFTSRGWVGS